MKAPMASKIIPKIGMARPAINERAPSASIPIAPSSWRMAMIVTPNGRSATFFSPIYFLELELLMGQKLLLPNK